MSLYKMRETDAGIADIAVDCAQIAKRPLTIVEVGSYAGESMEIFAKTGLVRKMYCIDPWHPGWDGNDPAAQTDMDEAEAMFDKRAAEAKFAEIVKHKGTLADFVLPEGEIVDLVYIDACHMYRQCKADIVLAIVKLKPIIAMAGHDYAPNWSGVVKAVNDTLGEPDKVYEDSSWIKWTKEQQ